jgi:prephenate dehydrogenase
MKTVGIIGFGSFGSFLVRKLNGLVTLKVYDPNQPVPAELDASLLEACESDYVVLAIPVDSYEAVLGEVTGLLGKNSVVVDISSVKTIPNQKLEQLLPGRKKVVTHPLFGPQSAEDSFDGHVVVMCPNVSDPEAYDQIKDFVQGLGLKVVEKAPEEHDKEMALAQGLTFYLARALLRSGVHDIELLTPSFKKLLDLAELESHHSEDLFRTIQLSNPYTAEIRQKFIDIATDLNGELS